MVAYRSQSKKVKITEIKKKNERKNENKKIEKMNKILFRKKTAQDCPGL